MRTPLPFTTLIKDALVSLIESRLYVPNTFARRLLSMEWNISALWKDGVANDLKRQKTVELSNKTIEAAYKSYRDSLKGRTEMVDLIDEIEKGLVDHEQAIAVVEGFMEKHATEAANAVNPLRLQGVLAKIKEHTMRLGAVMAKFPLVPPAQ